MRFLSIVFLSFTLILNAQERFHDPLSNSYKRNNSNEKADSSPAFQTSTDLPEFDCKDYNFYFWSIDGNGQIKKWEITGGIISYVETVFEYSPLTSLAYCNALNTSSIQSTFYGSNYYSFHDMIYWNGSSWIYISYDSTQPSFANAGGYGQNVFYVTPGPGSSNNNEIYSYDGDSVKLIYHSFNVFTVADLAVDISGNIWILSGPSSDHTDSLLMIDANGNLLKSWPFSLEGYHQYGAFLLNGLFYVGLGSANSSHPSSLIEIKVSDDSAFIQNVIPFPNSDFTDLASCKPGQPLATGITENDPASLFEVYQNSFTKSVLIKIPQQIQLPCRVQIFDYTGKILISDLMTTNSREFSLNSFPAGVFIIEISSGYISYRKKIVSYLK